MKKRIILSSVITMLLCLCMIGGATYALFTSETSVNIAVTSGKVKVEAEIVNLKTYSMDVLQEEGKFELGGTAKYEAGILTLTNVTPGDKVEFDIVVENSSNVDIQYKVNWLVEGKLSEVLVATANDADLANVGWTEWKKDAEKVQTINVVVELPVEVGNDYQEQTANIAFTLEAVQANANLVSNAAELKAAVEKGGSVFLSNDITVDANTAITVPADKEVVLYMNGNNISGVSSEIGKNRPIFAVKGSMTVKGEGSITHKHTGENMGWGNLTAAFSVEGGALTLEKDVKVVNLGGTNMAYGVDVNTTLGESVLNINGATIISTYTAVRLFNNHSAQNAIVNYNSGVVEGASRDIWVHNPSAAAVDANGIVNIDSAYNYDLTVQSADSYYGRIYQFAGGYTPVADAQKLDEFLASGKDVTLLEDLKFAASSTTANSGYGATGVSVKGSTFDGNGNTLTVQGANGTWGAAIHTTGGTIKNVVVSGAMRGIFTGGLSENLYIENVTFENVIYTFNSDGKTKNEYGVYIKNSTMSGWTSYSNIHKEVVFDNCKFTEGSGYAFLRPYNSSEFKNCVFDASFEIDLRATSTFENCYYGDTLITAENIDELGLIVGGLDKAVVK